MEDTLMHYGILGMHWGIRRTPEQLGHKPNKAQVGATKLQKYKDKKLASVDKMYAKAIAQVNEALEYDPSNKSLHKQLKDLEDLKAKDKKKIEDMSYTDVVNEQKAISQARKEKAAKVAGTVVKTTASTALWAAKMGLVGVRIYGTFKAAQIVGEMGYRAVEWLNSPEGQEVLNKGFNTVNTFVNFGDKAARLANPELGKYLDTKTLGDMAEKEVRSYVTSNFGNEINQLNNTVDQVNSAVNKASNTLDSVERRIRR